MSLEIIEAGVEQLDEAVELFDQYRQFYGQAHDIEGARAFLMARLSGVGDGRICSVLTDRLVDFAAANVDSERSVCCARHQIAWHQAPLD